MEIKSEKIKSSFNKNDLITIVWEGVKIILFPYYSSGIDVVEV